MTDIKTDAATQAEMAEEERLALEELQERFDLVVPVRVTLNVEQSAQLRFLQEQIEPTPPLAGMVRAAVAAWVANQTEDLGIPGHVWKRVGSGTGPRLVR